MTNKESLLDVLWDINEEIKTSLKVLEAEEELLKSEIAKEDNAGNKTVLRLKLSNVRGKEAGLLMAHITILERMKSIREES